ncbi:Arm DNA-binding domain-containing protein [Desulfurivibrio sp. C05AmB]|uniref:Arm DNA-binding domain-containing protein n=1 Tax=Desulfurivibrio sp. C05AmB TaxID=3374371 RepID=UPI00376EBFE5
MLESRKFGGLLGGLGASTKNKGPQKLLLEEKAMPKRTIPLVPLQIINAKVKEKECKLIDGGGLYLLVTTSGGKLW